MKTGISTACFYPLETETALQTVLELGFKNIEIFINSPCELSPDFILTLKSMADSYDAKIISIHPFTSGFENLLLFSNYPRRTEDGIKFYQQYANAAQLLGAKYITLHGTRNFQLLSDEQYYERYHMINQRLKAYGVVLAQENVNAYRSQSVEFIANMRKYLGDDVYFVFDVKQAVRAGYDPYDMIKAMGDRIVNVHINDNSQGSDCLLPGYGTMDYAKMVSLLDSLGYDGTYLIEVYRRNFKDNQDIAKSHQFLKQYIV